MSIPKIKYQHLTFSINSDGQEVPIDTETDKLYNTCTGINIVLGDESARFSTIQLDINSVEVFPENFEVLRLLFRQHAPFGFDYQELEEPASGSKIKGKYKDVNRGTTYPYTVTFSFRLENTEHHDSGSIKS